MASAEPERTTFSATSLRGRIDEVLQHRLAPGGSWSLVDYPTHLNCGDGALYVGARDTARRLGARIDQVLDRTSYRGEHLRRDSTVVIQAGGNWGGLYETHHRLRLQLLRDTVGRPVLQLPQSIHHASERHREELRRAVGEHGGLTLLVRDQRSLEVARADYDCHVELAPDLAFGMVPGPRGNPTTELTAQSRVDAEGAAGSERATSLPDGTTVWDWLSVPERSRSARLLSLTEGSYRAYRRWPSSVSRRLNVALSNALAIDNVRRGVGCLSVGRVVVTDRLHGHILSVLHGIPHVVVDDAFGKVAAFHSTWTAHAPLHEFAPTWSDVPDALERLRAP